MGKHITWQYNHEFSQFPTVSTRELDEFVAANEKEHIFGQIYSRDTKRLTKSMCLERTYVLCNPSRLSSRAHTPCHPSLPWSSGK